MMSINKWITTSSQYTITWYHKKNIFWRFFFSLLLLSTFSDAIKKKYLDTDMDGVNDEEDSDDDNDGINDDGKQGLLSPVWVWHSMNDLIEDEDDDGDGIDDDEEDEDSDGIPNKGAF